MALIGLFARFSGIVVSVLSQMAVFCHLDGVWGVAPSCFQRFSVSSMTEHIYILDLYVRTDTFLFFGGSFAPFRGLGVL